MTDAERKEQALQEYRKKLLQHKEIDAKVRTLREQVKQAKKEYDKTEEDLKALQSVGQIIAEVLRQLDEERCEFMTSLAPICAAFLHFICEFAVLVRISNTIQTYMLISSTFNRAAMASKAHLIISASLCARSHREGQQRAALCGGLPQQGGQGQAHSRHARGAGHDHAHHHALPAARGAICATLPPGTCRHQHRSICCMWHS